MGWSRTAAKIDIFERYLQHQRGDLDEQTFLRSGDHIGPYLTCMRGLRFERETSVLLRRSGLQTVSLTV